MEQISAILERARKAFESNEFAAAFELYMLCAESGNPEAQNFVAWMYETGKGTAIDLDRALRFYQRAAESGNLDSHFRLGNHYEHTGNLEEAAFHYGRAAEQKHMASAYRLACMIRYGTNILSLQMSLKWLTEAARLGHIWAGALVARQMLMGRIPGGRLRAIGKFLNVVLTGLVIAIRSPSGLDDPRLEK